jgi:chromosome segregation ATPase
MLKLVEKGTKWERLQARKAKAQERLAQAEQAREKTVDELAQALADENAAQAEGLRSQLRALDEIIEDSGLELSVLDERLAEARGDHLRREIKGLEAELEQIAAESEEATKVFEEAKRVFDAAQNNYQLGAELRQDRRRAPTARLYELTKELELIEEEELEAEEPAGAVDEAAIEEHLARCRAGEIKSHVGGDPVADAAWTRYQSERDEIRRYGAARRMGIEAREPACLALWPRDRARELMRRRRVS